MQLLDRAGIVAEILLAANKNDGVTLAKVQNLGNPLLRIGQLCLIRKDGETSSHLLLDVVKRIRGIDSEANQDDVGVWV